MSTEMLVQAGALGVLVLVLIGIGKLMKTLIDGLLEQSKALVAETRKQTEVLSGLVSRLESLEQEIGERRCVYRDERGRPVEGLSGFPRRMAPSVPDTG